MTNSYVKGLRRVQVFLIVAAVLWLGSLYVADSSWRVMWLAPPELPPGTDPSQAAYARDHVLESLLNAWHGVLQWALSIGVISAGHAKLAIEEGYALEGFLKLLSGLLIFISFWVASRALVSNEQGDSAGLSASGQGGNEGSYRQEPVISARQFERHERERENNREQIEELQNSLNAASLSVTNLMLDPQAQQFTEELSELSRHLKDAALNARQLRDQSDSEN